jgi:hypothetical protein
MNEGRYEERTWIRSSPSKGVPTVIWDGGSEQWELYEDGELRHYRILQRESLGVDRVREVLERLEESAIPAEIFAKHTKTSLQWTIEKKDLNSPSASPSTSALWELSPLSNWIPPTALFQPNAIRQ